MSFFIDDLLQEDRSSYNTVQGGIGNRAGNNNKQKIMPPNMQGIVTENYDSKLEKVLHELELCKSENAGLQREMVVKDQLLAMKDELICQLKK